MKRKWLFFRSFIKMTLIVIFIFSIPFITFSQTSQSGRVITGVVTDDKGEPLSGVSISVKGNTKTTTSDDNGKFSIPAANNSTLVLSYVGFGSREIAVRSQTTVNVRLEAENKTLNDVVVVGYGTQKKVNVIGSVVTVGSKELSSSPVPNISNALAGRLPGAVVQQSNGEPGNNGATILIRGMATLGNNEPLVVIDGILGRDLNSINPSDVESISILKDASAAIYGARAANGVILVTTKRGKEGSPLTVNYSFYQGLLTPTALPKMADAVSYAQMIREVQTYGGVDEANKKFSLDDIEKYKSGKFPWTHPNTDWINASFRKFSQTRNHNVALSGGNKAVDYYVSFGTEYENGIFKNSSTSFNRYNLKATVNAKVNEYLTLGVDINGSQENRNYPSVDAGFNLDGAIKSLPTSPAVYPNGLPGPDIAYGQNPVVTVTDQTGFDNSKRYRANNIFSANLKIPGVKGLTLSSYYAYDINLGQRKLFQKPWTLYQLDEPAYLAAGNTGVEDGSAFLVGTLKGVPEPWLRDFYDDARTKTFNIKADYTATIKGVHNISAFVAYESSEYDGKGIDAYRRYFISSQLPYLFAGGDAEKNNNEFVSLDSRINYFGRLSYNYKETYLFQFSMRRDGSLRFSKEHGRWGNFPSVLAGWRISNENFWKNNIRFIDYFKLRASWGQLGNDLVAPFQYLTAYSLSTGYVLGSGRSYSTGLSQIGATNPNITWEVANVYNAGFESMFFHNHFTLNADFFYQRRNNILVKRNASVPDFTGIQLPDENFGIVDNRGFEISLGYNNKVRDFIYSLNGNIAFARNKVIEFDEPARNVPWQVLTGKPQGSELVYHSIGIFRDEEQITKTPHVSGAIPGDIIIQDYNNDGQINSDDRVLHTKTVNPEITYGVSFSVTYKNWSLNGLVQGAANASRRVLVGLQGFAGNYFAYDADGRWTPDNINANKPRAFDRNDAYWRNDYVTDYSYQSGAYARLKNLQLAYTIPVGIQNKIRLKDAQIYLSGQNLFLLYSGNKLIDPEVGGIRTTVATDPAPGVYSYPIMRVFTVGARISL
ncbi:SusC/RagA family TonB-linked outer membrane protein [Segetibacter koreensis]|uniref:SusC/RagA family TonB-linked outer membrane protein n=1 Tax=Segetibacter koreensis TaxID=398037 RepID=UPI001B7F904E|nr:TonB-dependent receptor [Segetibacter koreensis]